MEQQALPTARVMGKGAGSRWPVYTAAISPLNRLGSSWDVDEFPWKTALMVGKRFAQSSPSGPVSYRDSKIKRHVYRHP